MRIPGFLLTLVLVSLLLPWPESTALAATDGMRVEIKITPQTIVLSALRKGNWVTVHADVPFSTVDVHSVTLNGIAAARVKPDNRGDLVAKVPLTSLKGDLRLGWNTLLFEGLTKEGTPFSGTDTVFVKVIMEKQA